MSELRSGTVTRDNPFVGLRPFFAADSLYFFGRDEQVTALLDLLKTSRFVPVLGSSGSGKSSLVRAGLLPTLQAGFMVTDRDGWRIAIALPGDTPVENLAEALLRAVGETATGARVIEFAQQIRDDLDDAIVTLLQSRLTVHENVLVLLDQFEEIFAFRLGAGSETDDAPGTSPDANKSAERLRRRQDASLLVSVLLRLAERKEIPVYIVTTMRTDFLGDCDLFTGLPEAVNRSGYLVPRLTRSQLRQAVEGPARLMGARVAPRLVDRVLNDVGDRMDRLPLMQHALQRTYGVWQSAGMIGPLDVEDLEQAGGLDKALDVHGEQVIAGFDPLLVERVFKRLTSVDSQQRRVRRPARLSELRTVAEGDDVTLKKLLDQCAQEGTNFLFAAKDGQNNDPRYNISHESLIRQWNRLRDWVDAEQAQREWYEQLAERAALYARNRDAGLLSRLDLRIAQETIELRKPTAAWAERYPNAAAGFTRTMDFVRESAAWHRKERQRRFAMVGAALLLVLLTGASILRSGLVASAAIARVDEVAREAAIERMLDIDPTIAAALAAELAAESDDPSTWTPNRVALLQRALHGTYALAEHHDVWNFAVDSRGEELAISFVDGRTELHPIDGNGPPRAVLYGSEGDTTVSVFYVKGGGVVVGSTHGVVRHWGADVATDDAPTSEVTLPALRQLAVTADSSQLVALDTDGAIWSWSLLDRTPRKVELPPVSSFTIHATDSARVVVVTDSGDVRVLDPYARTSKNIAGNGFVRRPGRERSIRFVALSQYNDAMVIADGARGPLQYVSGDRVIGKVGRDSGSYNGADFNPKFPELLLTSEKGFVEIYYARGGTADLRDSLVLGPSSLNGVTTAMYSREGNWIIASTDDGEVRWSSAQDTVSSMRLLGHKAYLFALTTTAGNRRLISADVDGVLRVWRAPSMTQAVPFSQTVYGPTNVMLSTDGAFGALAYANDSVEVVDLRRSDKSKASVVLADSFPARRTTELSPRGNRLFVEYDDPQRREVHDLLAHEVTQLTVTLSHVTRAAFSDADRVLVLIHDDGRTQFLNPASGKPLRADWRTPDTASALAVSRDGATIAIAIADTVYLFSSTGDVDGKPRSLALDLDTIYQMQFSPDGTLLLVMDFQRTSVVVDLATNGSRVVGDWSRYTTADAISAAGDWIALATSDRTIRLFPARDSLAQPIEITNVGGTVVHLAFGAGDTTLVATKANGDIYLWPLTLALGSVGVPMTLHHAPSVPKLSGDFPYARTVISADGRLLTSMLAPFLGPPRIGRWELSPGALQQQLLHTTNVCLNARKREQLLPGETGEKLRTRIDACEERAGRRR